MSLKTMFQMMLSRFCLEFSRVLDVTYMTNDASLRWMETSHDDMTSRVRLKIKKRDLPTDQPMDAFQWTDHVKYRSSLCLTKSWTDRPTDRPTDQPTDKPSHRRARGPLKTGKIRCDGAVIA